MNATKLGFLCYVIKVTGFVEMLLRKHNCYVTCYEGILCNIISICF